MKNFTTNFTRSNVTESSHASKILIVDNKNNIILSSGDDEDYIYPRSSIKVFQALPFILTNAEKYFNLNRKCIALSCSSHRGEPFHIKELELWISKIGVNKNILKCGIHNPLNHNASEQMQRLRKNPNQLHNNCAGKHLAMITSCIINNYNNKNYLDFDHPHQISIRKIFEKFSNDKIKRKYFGIDGCSAPQYAFKINKIAHMLTNLNKSYNDLFDYNTEVKKVINSIFANPKYIGGSDSLDSKIMTIAKKKIFCKGGAEGVFLFTDLNKGLSGVIKIVDGNERAIPYLIFNLFKKLKIMNKNELSKLEKYCEFKLINHANIVVGNVNTNIV